MFAVGGVPMLRVQEYQEIETPVTLGTMFVQVFETAIVWCLEPPIARFGSLILKVVTVPTLLSIVQIRLLTDLAIVSHALVIYLRNSFTSFLLHSSTDLRHLTCKIQYATRP